MWKKLFLWTCLRRVHSFVVWRFNRKLESCHIVSFNFFKPIFVCFCFECIEMHFIWRLTILYFLLHFWIFSAEYFRMTNASMIVGIVLVVLGAISAVIGTIRCFTVKVKNTKNLKMKTQEQTYFLIWHSVKPVLETGLTVTEIIRVVGLIEITWYYSKYH